MQQALTFNPGITLGAGHEALAGGGLHAPFTIQPQPPAAKQQGEASEAFGMKFLTLAMVAAAGFEQVVGPHVTDVPPAPAVTPEARSADPALGTLTGSFGGDGVAETAPSLQPSAAIRHASTNTRRFPIPLIGTLCNRDVPRALKGVRDV